MYLILVLKNGTELTYSKRGEETQCDMRSQFYDTRVHATSFALLPLVRECESLVARTKKGTSISYSNRFARCFRFISSFGLIQHWSWRRRNAMWYAKSILWYKSSRNKLRSLAIGAWVWKSSGAYKKRDVDLDSSTATVLRDSDLLVLLAWYNIGGRKQSFPLSAREILRTRVRKTEENSFPNTKFVKFWQQRIAPTTLARASY